MSGPVLTVGEIFRQHGPAFRDTYGATLPPPQRRAMHALEVCRTAALGGHVQQCDACGHQVILYNSCRNRHCPTCQNLDKAEWLEQRRQELLPVEYFHVVFTLPQCLTPLALQNQPTLYNLLFSAASQALLRIAADRRHLGARIGFLAVLHTWGQSLLAHPHLHCLVPAGGLSEDHTRWIGVRRKTFFLPVRVLSRMFRWLFLQGLKKAFEQGVLKFHGTLALLADPKAFSTFLRRCLRKEWVVYAKPPFSSPQTVLDYLARYTYRVAISNNRLVSLENRQVSFRFKDYRNGGEQRIMTLPAEQFIRRFLLHILPNRFVRIRYFGLLCNRHRQEKLALSRRLLGVPTPSPTPDALPQDRYQLFARLTGRDPKRCPCCGQGRMHVVENIESMQITRPRAPPRIGSS